MADYIKRDDAIKEAIDAVDDWDGGYDTYRSKMIENYLNDIPAADVRENVRGAWIWDDDGYDWGIGAYICSNCKSRPGTWWAGDRNKNPLLCSGGSFCGNCGADMRGVM